MEGKRWGRGGGRKEGRKNEGKTEEQWKKGPFLSVNKRNKLNTVYSIKRASHYPINSATPLGN